MEGRFAHFLNAVFESQDSLGLKTWKSYARTAGVTDIAAFESSLEESLPDRITAGIQMAARLGVTATPTVFINGWRLGVPPTADLILAWGDAILRGEDPFDPDPDV